MMRWHPLRSTRYLAVSLVSLSGLAIPCSAWANPNHEDAMRPMAVHGGDVAKQLHAQASKLSAETFKEVSTFMEGASKGQLGKFGAKPIGETRVKFLQLFRYAHQLKMLGEPSGVEFDLYQADVGGVHYSRIVQGWAGLPTSQTFMTRLRAQLQKEAPERARILQKLERLAQEQKWEEAERELNRFIDDIELGAGFLSQPEREQLFAPFAAVRSAIESAMNRIRTQTAEEILKKSLAEQLPNYPAQAAEIEQAIGQVAQTGQANWQGATVSGPQLVTKLDQRWREVHAATLRCRGLQWALKYRFKQGGYDQMTDPGGYAPNQVDELQVAYNRFTASMIKSLADLISVDARRASAEEAPTLYLAYLNALAPLVQQFGLPPHRLTDVEAALKQLAAKAPAFAVEVAAYDDATRELLRWRRRAASAVAAAVTSGYQPLYPVLQRGTTSQSSYIGLFPQQEPEKYPPTLMAAAYKVMPTAAQNLLGNKVKVADVIRVAPESKSAMSRYQTRTYATIPAGLDLAGEVDLLKHDLLVADGTPALTLAAAQAIDSAVRGDMAAIGGEVTGTHLEGLITRFAGLPNAAALLTPGGVVPDEGATSGLLAHVVMRFDVRPEWVHHDQFFMQLSP